MSKFTKAKIIIWSYYICAAVLLLYLMHRYLPSQSLIAGYAVLAWMGGNYLKNELL